MSAAMAVGQAKNYRKDVVKKLGDLALLLRVQSGFTEDKSPHAKIGESAHESSKNWQNRLVHEPILCYNLVQMSRFPVPKPKRKGHEHEQVAHNRMPARDGVCRSRDTVYMVLRFSLSWLLIRHC